MKITALVENTSNNKNLKSKHGLSIYIETQQHKVLFDTGSDDTFICNASKLGIDLAQVDTLVISHGHFDHAGALSSFLKLNSKAKIYIHRLAFEAHYIKVLFAKINIGLDKELIGNSRFILTDGNLKIDDELFILSDVEGQFLVKSNSVLLKRTKNAYVQDDFSHEQNLIVSSKGKTALFTGCSDKGISNIINAAKEYQPEIQAVFGGFHLYNPATKSTEPADVLQCLADELSMHNATFHTGHCTGLKALVAMRNIMGNDKVKHFITGTLVEL